MGGVSVSAIETKPVAADRGFTFVYAPGAGSSLNDPFGAFLAPRLAVAGLTCLRFQFPYMEAKRRRPDAPATLEATWRAVGDFASGAGRLVIGGRSMGGRIASQVAAQGFAVVGVALFAYPLHPPGRPDQRRDGHLAAISSPLLFCSGTRDAFAAADELQALVTALPGARLCLLADADHGFAMPKSSSRTQEDVWEEALAALLAFLI